MYKRSLLAASVLALAASAWGQAIRTEELSPIKWVEQVTPEALPKLKYPEYADALDKAQMEMQSGRYRLAMQTLRLAEQIDPARRGVMMGEILYRTGQFAEAQDVLARPELANDNAARRLRAMAMTELGNRQQAAELLRAAIAAEEANPLPRWELARVLQSMGKVSEERQALEWFAQKGYLDGWRKNELAEIDSAETLSAIAGALDRLATLNGQYREDTGLHQDILGMFVRAYDELDRRYADAHVMAAAFFQSHDDERRAREELEQALAINPNHIEAMQLAGGLALAKFDFDRCEKMLVGIEAAAPDHPAGKVLRCEMLLMERLPNEAQQTIGPLVGRDGQGATVLAHLAACEALRFDQEALAKRLNEADAVMPESSEAYVTAAAFLLPAFQFRDAARLLETAVKRTPHWNTPRNMLALAYMQQTDMEKARPVLEDARKLDPFNVATTNYMRLLDTLSEYSMAKSEHFAVRYSPRTDPFLPGEVLTYMEQNYARICGEFGHDLKEQTVLELMPTREDFAVRTTGKPWIGTIGASAGSLITMVAPRRGRETMGNFDWTDVTRHEFVHTVTLEATHHRIPRWMTEGLAVAEQTSPLAYDQAKLLSEAVRTGKLFPIVRLNWGFVRPKRPGDQPLAYAQSYLLVKYIYQTRGHGAIMAMMQGYRDGWGTEQVVRKCLGMGPPELDEAFAAWAKEQLEQIGMDAMSLMRTVPLKVQAENLIKQKQYAKALEAWQKLAEIAPMDPMVHQRLAGLYLHKDINQPEKAIEHLHALDRIQLKDNRYAIRLAKLYLQLGRAGDAAMSARRACQINPYDANARQLLAKALGQSGQAEEAKKQEELVQWLNDPARKGEAQELPAPAEAGQ